jgi:hypothetical protein
MTCPLRPPWLHLLIIFCDEYKLQSSSSSNSSSPLFFHLSWVQIFSAVSCFQTLNLCSSFNVRNQVSHPYKTRGKIILSYILVSAFLGNWREKVLNWMKTNYTGMSNHLTGPDAIFTYEKNCSCLFPYSSYGDIWKVENKLAVKWHSQPNGTTTLWAMCTVYYTRRINV